MARIIKKVLIVDDSQHTGTIKIENYKQIFRKIKLHQEYLCDYDVEFIWENTIQGALQRLNNKSEVFHVILIDYEFNNDENCLKGVHLVKEIRRTINKKCKIIFYTMNGYSGIDKKEYVELINSDIYRFFSKSGETLNINDTIRTTDNADELIVKGIIEAINESDPISNALESYLLQYSEIFKNGKITVENNEYSLQELIDSIRLNTKPGNVFVEKIFKIAVLDCVDILR